MPRLVSSPLGAAALAVVAGATSLGMWGVAAPARAITPVPSGNVCANDPVSGDFVGYVAAQPNINGYLDLTTDSASAATVQIATGPQQNLTLVGAPAGTPFLGGVAGFSGNDLEAGSAAYAWSVETSGTTPGATAQSATTSIGTRSAQSAIWTLGPGSTLTPQWVNSDGSTTPTTVFENTFGLYFTGDLAAFHAQYSGEQADALTLTLSPSGACPKLGGTPQTITFTSSPPSPARVNGGYMVSATGGGSGNPVAFASNTPTVCTVSGSTVSFVGAGSCDIEADQAGGDGYAAGTADQTFPVENTPSVAISVTLAPASISGTQTSTPTATVSGNPPGTVQFTVDGTNVGSPVNVPGTGSVTGPALGGTDHPLAVGTHKVGATYLPAAGSTTPSVAADLVTLTVGQGSTTVTASTTTTVSISADHLTATVVPVAPATGTPTGSVSFNVDGKPVGTATLSNGVATLPYTLKAGPRRGVRAVYAGDTGFATSAGTAVRTNPTLTASVHSTKPVSSHGWYAGPVTVSFACAATSAPLVGTCPTPVTLTTEGRGQSVARTITATDGGTATARVLHLRIDLTAPTVVIRGIRGAGATADGTCVGRDALSGIVSCTITHVSHGGQVTYTAVATDLAGNTATAHRTIPS